MQYYVSKEVVCPFYHKEETTKIKCERLCDDYAIQESIKNAKYKPRF
jgi:hypothetical protein